MTAPAAIPPRTPESPAILVVDDDPLLLDLVWPGLERHGYTTVAAKDGAEALAILEASNGEVSLVLCDVIMPRLDGLEVACQVRKRWPTLVITLMSGGIDRANLLDVLRALAVPVLWKPFSITDLLTVVRALAGTARFTAA